MLRFEKQDKKKMEVMLHFDPELYSPSAAQIPNSNHRKWWCRVGCSSFICFSWSSLRSSLTSSATKQIWSLVLRIMSERECCAEIWEQSRSLRCVLCRIFLGTGKACVCETCHLLQSVEINVCSFMMENKQGGVQNSGDQSKAEVNASVLFW